MLERRHKLIVLSDVASTSGWWGRYGVAATCELFELPLKGAEAVALVMHGRLRRGRH